MSVGYLKKCSNGRTPKRRHPTREAAEQQRQALIAAGRYVRSRSNTYPCAQCASWHVGQTHGAKPSPKRKGKTQPRRWDTQ